MEPPNFWPSTTYLSAAAVIPPLPVATKHHRLIRGQQGQSRLRRGRKTRGEQRRRGVRKCHRETLSHAQVGPALKERSCSGQRLHPLFSAANEELQKHRVCGSIPRTGLLCSESGNSWRQIQTAEEIITPMPLEKEFTCQCRAAKHQFDMVDLVWLFLSVRDPPSEQH